MPHVSVAEPRPQLIKAAIDLMTREGVAAGNTRAIAAELGVAQATVHYTFGTKEDLYRAVMEQLTHDLIAQVQRAAHADAGNFMGLPDSGPDLRFQQPEKALGCGATVTGARSAHALPHFQLP